MTVALTLYLLGVPIAFCALYAASGKYPCAPIIAVLSVIWPLLLASLMCAVGGDILKKLTSRTTEGQDFD